MHSSPTNGKLVLCFSSKYVVNFILKDLVQNPKLYFLCTSDSSSASVLSICFWKRRLNVNPWYKCPDCLLDSVLHILDASQDLAVGFFVRWNGKRSTKTVLWGRGCSGVVLCHPVIALPHWFQWFPYGKGRTKYHGNKDTPKFLLSAFTLSGKNFLFCMP